MRVPTIMRWPGKIPAGSVCSEVAAACDILPTFAKLAKAELPKRKIDGKNIWPLMSGREGAKSPHKQFYYYRGAGLRAVRSGDWKLHIGGGNKKQKKEGTKPALTLYNLAEDIGETTNVAAANQKIVQRLYKRALAFDKSLKADARPAGEVKTAG
jgi:arylsulfatase A-like enzyme